MGIDARWLLAVVGCAAGTVEPDVPDVPDVPEPTPVVEDPEPVGLLRDCEGPSASGEGPWSLVATNDALYCGQFREEGTLDEERDVKAWVRVVAGTHAFAEAVGEISLGVCAEVGEARTPLTVAGPAVVEGRSFTADTVWRLITVEQPLHDDDGAPWVLRIEARGPMSTAPLYLDGTYRPFDSDEVLTLQLCEGSCDAGTIRRLDSCHFDNAGLERHRVVAGDLSMSLDIRIGWELVATQPGGLMVAEGTLGDSSFEVDDYWSLLYNPAHHHTSRDARVLLDPPIGDVHAIEVRHLDPLGEDPPTTITLWGADGELETRTPSTDEHEYVSAGR